MRDYLLAALLAALGLAVRAALDPLVIDRVPYMVSLVAVAMVLSFAGTGPAILAALLGYVGAEVLFVRPRGVFAPHSEDVASLVSSVSYLIACGAIIAFGRARTRAHARALAASAQLADRNRKLEREVETRAAAEVALQVAHEERARQMEVVRRNERLLRELVDGSPDSIVSLKDREGRFITVSSHFEELLGVTGEEIRGKTDFDIFRRDRAENYREHDGSVVESGHAMLVEEEADLVDGAHVFLASKFPLRDASGEIWGIGAIAHDITERKRAERLLAARERQLQAIADNAPDVITRVDRDLRYVLVSRALGEMRGGVPSDFVGKTRREAGFAPEVCDLLDAATAKVFETGQPQRLQWSMVGPDGKPHHWEQSLVPESGDDGRTESVLAVSRDISEHKALEQALQERAAEVETIMDVAPVAILIAHDPECHIITANRAGTVYYEIRPGENVSASPPPGRKAIQRRYFAGGRLLRPEELPMQRAAVSGQEVTAEFEVELPSGARRAFWGFASPLRDARGGVRGAIGIFVDVTDRRRAEEALREANRRKDEFLAMLSHELRNPLAPIRNGVFILGRAPAGSEPARRALEVIDRQVAHMSRLIDDLLDMTRITRGKVQLHVARVDLRELVRRCVEDYRPVFARRGVELELEEGPAPVEVPGDWARLVQVVGNLLQNAVKFSGPGSKTVASLYPQGAFAELRVRDGGVGIAPEMLGRLFQPFSQIDSSLDRSHGGLGLGLALTRGLVEIHGGEVSARSEGLGRGSEFLVRLPLAPELFREARADPAPTPP